MIEINNLSKKYGEKIIYKNLNLKIIDDNSIITLWGASGSGKTTLINLIMGYEAMDSGEININGQPLDVNYSREKIAVVKQDLCLFGNVRVLSNLKLIEDDEEEIDKYLKMFGISECKNQKLKELSGGQKQRVAIIRALLKKPQILICDEPSNGLDEENFRNLIQALQMVNQLGTQVIISTHDIRFEQFSKIHIKIEDYSAKQYVNENVKVESENVEVSNHVIKQAKLFTTFTTILKNQREQYINKIVLSSILALVFVTLFTIRFSALDKYKTNFFNGMSDQIMVMSIRDVFEPYLVTEENEVINVMPDKLFWGQDDLDFIENIDGVKEVILDDDKVQSVVDKDGNSYQQTIPFDQVKQLFSKSSAITSAPGAIELQLTGVSISSELYNYYQGGNTIGLEIVEGSYPQDDTNQILIPDFLGSYLIDERDLTDISELISQEISVDTFNDNQNKDVKSTYKISGIYDSGYKQMIKSQYNIYYSYQTESLKSRALTSTTEELFEGAKDMLAEASKEQQDYFQQTYSSYDNWKLASGYRYNDMHIILDENANQKQVYEQIQNKYPNNIIKSRYTYENDKRLYAQSFGRLKRQQSLFIIIFSAIIGSILYLIQKGYYLVKKKDYALLYSLGYSKRNIIKLMVFENIVDIIIILLSIIVITWILHFLPLSAFNYIYVYVINLSSIGYIAMFLILVNLLQIIINVMSLKYNELNKVL